tara:strand:- start:194 stop:721 length:528 start_codon:yes stop_codon:yes gene_type:complete
MHNNLPNKFYFISNLKNINIDKLDNKSAVIYRNYKNKLNINEIIKVKSFLSKKNIKFFLSNNFKLSLKLGLDGAYLPSFNKDFKHLSYKIKSSFIIIGSAHNVKEIRLKESQKIRLIFISSVFKKNKNFLGIYKFKILNKLTKKKVVALGGISKSNIKKVSLLDCYGLAGISYFQ